ncbi:hypothetical protein VN12_12990 [Pirellula sp. SH-Sr6A]|nr:hypothetical protein VN12_12990 [Pirellula sp. SH-Sr6A]
MSRTQQMVVLASASILLVAWIAYLLWVCSQI